MSIWGACEIPGENSSHRTHRRGRPTLWIRTKAKRTGIDSYLDVRKVVRKSMKRK